MPNEQPILRTDRPPFVCMRERKPELTARDFTACFRQLARIPQRLSTCYSLLAQQQGFVNETDALHRVCLSLAHNQDAGIGSDPQVGYHNVQHVSEVLLAAHFIGLLLELPKKQHHLLLLAALAHDYDHDGGVNGERRFHLERHAINQVSPCLQAEGVLPDTQQQLAAMILTTEIVHGLPFARAWFHTWFNGAEAPDLALPAPELACLTTDSTTTYLAIALSEADALASVGLGRSYAELQLRRLSLEWQKPLGKKDLCNYLNKGFGQFLLATYFTPNLERLKASLRQSMHCA